MIDFASNTSYLLLNPRIPDVVKNNVIQLFEKKSLKKYFKGHVFVSTSGSTKKEKAPFKLVALSKEALLTSAKSVNDHIEATNQDIWLNCLPIFHVGGIGIYARAHLNSTTVFVLEKWDVLSFYKELVNKKITLTSLVPAQVYDLVMNKIKAPEYMRSVIVGGGALPNEIYEKAKELGWPLMQSYGLTECSSQVATSKIGSSTLFLLDHIGAKVDKEGYLMIQSPSLLTAEILFFEDDIKIDDPKKQGWFKTDDLALLNGNTLLIEGRSSDFIKIGGESVLFSKLEKNLEEIKLRHQFKADAVLIKREDARLGVVIELVTTTKEVEKIVKGFNDSVMPYEAVRKIHFVDEIPRTAIKKINENDLFKLL